MNQKLTVITMMVLCLMSVSNGAGIGIKETTLAPYESARRLRASLLPHVLSGDVYSQLKEEESVLLTFNNNLLAYINKHGEILQETYTVSAEYSLCEIMSEIQKEVPKIADIYTFATLYKWGKIESIPLGKWELERCRPEIEFSSGELVVFKHTH